MKQVIFTVGFTSQKHIARSGGLSHLGSIKKISVETDKSSRISIYLCNGIIRPSSPIIKLKPRCPYFSTNESGRLAPPEMQASHWSRLSAASLAGW